MQDKNQIWVVYMVKTQSGKFYTGITTNLKRRFQEHSSRKKGAKFFHISSAKEIVFQETHANRSEALKREFQIKSMSRTQKTELIKRMV